jgi:signal transduction histidine kinase
VRGGLTGRMLISSGLLAVIIATAFAVLLSSVSDLRASERRARQSEEVLVEANRLERLVIDLETGQRGFIITGEERFLEPWRDARAALPNETSTLERLVADSPQQEARAKALTKAAESYLQDYSIPLVDGAMRDLTTARSVAATSEGGQRINAIRAEFDRFVGSERELAAAREQTSDAVAQRAVAAAVAGLAGSILLIVVFAWYLNRAIVGPVRRAAIMADRLASGDLAARIGERGAGEIGLLEHSFNSMARSLERSREELAASRTRIVAAGDHARRRIERDLHDGTQQRLVSLALDVRSAEATVADELPELRAQLARVADGLRGAMEDLRELSHGIHPAILSEGGLSQALKALGRRSTLPVELEVNIPTRLPAPVEVAAYYVVSEALANATKYAQASLAEVEVRTADDRLRLTVRDDGIGGASLKRGSGLIGLADRVEALGGTLTIHSGTGQGTRLEVDLPIHSDHRSAS